MLDEAETLTNQNDHAGFPSQFRQSRDVVLSPFSLSLAGDVAPGIYQIPADMYTPPGVEVVPVLNPGGEVVGDSVTLGDVRILE